MAEEEEEERRSLETKFAAAVKVIQTLPEEGDISSCFSLSHRLPCLLNEHNCTLALQAAHAAAVSLAKVKAAL